MNSGIIKIATCQFPVCGDIDANAAHVAALIQRAADEDADIAHFPECALSGYASVDFNSFTDYDWNLLKTKTLEIIERAGELDIWVILGSSHRLTKPNKPHNSLYLISSEGKLVDRYDKRFCTEIDFDNYTPGDHFVHFDINGIKCSLLICFDLRFPELYRALYKDGVKCVFQSFYNARQQGPSIHSDIMQQTMQANAANNSLWVSMTNSCGWFCPYPSCFIQPDGRIIEQLPEHTEGLMINTVDLTEKFYDPTADFRDNAIEGKLTNSDERLSDQRSVHRDKL